jgi:hypothetical protein
MPRKTKTPDPETQKLIAMVEETITSEFESDELACDAGDASRALSDVRRLFYGTPLEKTLTDAMIVCDTVARIASGR